MITKMTKGLVERLHKEMDKPLLFKLSNGKWDVCESITIEIRHYKDEKPIPSFVIFGKESCNIYKNREEVEYEFANWYKRLHVNTISNTEVYETNTELTTFAIVGDNNVYTLFGFNKAIIGDEMYPIAIGTSREDVIEKIIGKNCKEIL